MRVRLSSNYTKQLFATMFAVAFILLGVCIGSDNAKQVYAAEVTTTAHESGKFVYATYADKDEVKNYLGKSAPGTKEGYLFAGWYTDEDCTQTIKNAKEVDEATTSIFYAKYVPENVLSTKVQISLDDISTTDEYDTRNMRFVSSVDDLTYGQVGFALKYQEKDSTTWRTFKNEGTYVFTRIVAAEGNDDYKFSPKVVNTKSEYFITATWKGANETGLTNDTSEGATTDFNTGYYVRAYWVTMDGVTVYGPVRYVSVNDGLNTNIINVAVKGAPTTTVGDSVDVSGYTDATGTVAYHDGTYSHVRIDLGAGVNRSAVLKSVTRFTVDGKQVDYRNLYTKYVGTTASEDTSWYTVYGAKTNGEYVIATSADLYGLKTIVNGKTQYFADDTIYVIADIEVNKGIASPTGWSTSYTEDGEAKIGTDYGWTQIGNTTAVYFQGIFDGQGHTISGVHGTFNNSYFGMFGLIGKDTKLKNFELKNSYFYHNDYGHATGSIVGASMGGTIENVHSYAHVYKTSTRAVGNCDYVGGIVGRQYTNPLTITNCSYEGTLTTDRPYAGGILGGFSSSSATIQECKFGGKIYSSGTYAGYTGGIVGGNTQTATIIDCESSGYIESAKAQTGGLVGANTNSLTITGSKFTGSIKSTADQAGGLVGVNTKTATITNCLSSGSIESSAIIIGGLAGDTQTGSLTIEDSLFSGTITCTKESTNAGIIATGGLVGRVYTGTISITSSLNSGEVEFDATKLQGPTAYGRVIGYYRTNATGQTINKVYFTKEGKNSTEPGYGVANTALCWAVDESDILGKYAYFNTSLDFGEEGKWALVAEGTPVLKTFTDEVPALPVVPEDVNIDWYKGVESTTYTMGSSEAGNDANVKSLKGLAYLVSEGITFDGKTVNLGSDIELNTSAPTTNAEWDTYIKENDPTEWKAIGTHTYEFAGIFDGGMHSIEGIYMDNNTYGTGFFRSTASGSTIKNLKIENSYFNAKTNDNYAYVGSVVANCAGNLENIYSNAVVKTAGHYVGGIAGQLWDSNSSASARIVLSNCWFDGEVSVTGKNNCGGIVGAVTNGYWTIQDCLNTGNINLSGTCSWIGGIGGRLTNSKARWNGTNDVETAQGALVMTNCLNIGTITYDTYKDSIGSVFGEVHSSVRFENVYATNESCAAGIGKVPATVTSTGTLVDKANITGESASTNFLPLSADDTAWVVTETTPILKIFNN